MKHQGIAKAVKNSRFPKSIFFGYFGALLLLSGVHIALLLGMQRAHFNEILLIHVILIFWALVAGGLTLYTRHQVRKTYELPMLRLADAAAKIAQGDFSVRVEPINEHEKFDYLDVMIGDFNLSTKTLHKSFIHATMLLPFGALDLHTATVSHARLAASVFMQHLWKSSSQSKL